MTCIASASTSAAPSPTWSAVDDAGRVTPRQVRRPPRRPVDRRDGRPRRCWPPSWALDSRGAARRDTERIVHGTTVATNALLERKGARVGMLTTEGHRDVIEMREGLKDDRYNLRMPPPVPLVPRARRLGVRERMRFDGSVADAARPSARSAAADRRAGRRGRRGGRGLLPARLPRPAPRAGDAASALARALPDAYVSLSSRGAAADQGVRALLHHRGQRLRRARRSARYLGSLDRAARARRAIAGDVLIMQSHGGVATDRRLGAAGRGRGALGPRRRHRGRAGTPRGSSARAT